MKYLLILACVLAGCASGPNPKSWAPMFDGAPGVPDDVSRGCYNAAMKDLQRSWPESPGSRAGYAGWDADERECTLKRYMRACIVSAFNVEAATGFKVRPNSTGWSGTWRRFLDDAAAEACTPDGGGTPRALALADETESTAEQAGAEICIPCQ